jgi:TonB family protein
MASSKKLRTAVILGSILLHAGVGVGMFASGVWSIERLGGDLRVPSVAIVLPPEPAPAGGAAMKLPEAQVVQKEKKVPKDLTQLAEKRIEAPVKPTASQEPGEGSGDGSGKGSGSAGDKGECLFDCGPGPGSAAQPKVELPKPEEPELVPPNVLTMNWLSGEKQIHPSDTTKTQMMRDGTTRTIGIVKVCIDESGRVASASLSKSTKYPSYDAQLVTAIRDWRYKPFSARGKSVKVCGIVTFVYSIK